jgi:triacylglycerol esterase/lipase EstA (alpha/beta hydrolase family)
VGSFTGVLSYTIKRVTVNLGGGWLQQWINNSFTMGTQNSRTHYSDLLLNMSVNWKKYSIGFSQDVNAPGINYLLPCTG